MVRSRRARGRPGDEKRKGIQPHASLHGTRKSIWEHYNELTAELDATQARVWHNMADTTLMFAGIFAAVLSIYIGFVLQQLKPDTGVVILNQISNKLRNTSDPVPDASDDVPPTYLPAAMELLSMGLNLILIVSVLALVLKHWLWMHTPNSRTYHTPEEQARKRELNAHSFWRYHILFAFGLLPFLMQIAVYFFSLGSSFTVESLGTKWEIALGFNWSGTNRKLYFIVIIALFTLMTVGLLIWYGLYAFSILSRDLERILERIARRILVRMFDIAPDPEIIYVDISNLLFTHTSMVPKNLSIFIQLFSLPVEHPRLRIKSLAPWTQLSSLLPSMLMEVYSHSRYNLLPALRLCLVVSGQGQMLVNREAKRVYNTIKTSDPLQNLYLHLLLSQLHATAGDTDHWQDACRILRCLEHSEEHTSELLWLVDSIQLYTPWIKEDFTTRIVEFLHGVVVYLTKCPSDEHNGDLLRSAIIIAAQWLISRQLRDKGDLPWQYILWSRDVHSSEANRETFVLADNLRLSPVERLRFTISIYEILQLGVFDWAFVMLTLIIPVMAIEGFVAEKNGGSISDAVPRIQSGDLRWALEGLWGLWEGGFNQSDLLRFVVVLAVPPSPSVGDTQSSMVVLLLKEYLQQIKESPALITEKAFRFIDATLEYSLTTGTTRDELELQLQDVQSPNPWISLHIDNILGRRSTPRVVDLEGVTTLDSRVKAIVSRKRLDLYISSNVEPEPDILTLLVQFDDPVISLEAFGQGVNPLNSPLSDESDGRNTGSPRPFTFAVLDQEKRSHLISRLFDCQQSKSMCQSICIMLTEDLYPGWERLPTDWRRDIATALVEATEWMVKGQKILAEVIKKRHRMQASGKAKQLIGATALVNRSDTEPRRKRKIPLETRDERFEERLDACAQVYLRLFATTVEELGESAKPRTQHIVAFLVDIPDVLYDEDAIQRIQHVLGI